MYILSPITTYSVAYAPDDWSFDYKRMTLLEIFDMYLMILSCLINP